VPGRPPGFQARHACPLLHSAGTWRDRVRIEDNLIDEEIWTLEQDGVEPAPRSSAPEFWRVTLDLTGRPRISRRRGIPRGPPPDARERRIRR
jgi:hypothetical protein